MNKVIEVKNLVKEYKGKRAVDDLSFDVYEGERIGADKKSLAYSIRFRAADRTLEDKDVNEIMDKIINALKKLGAELRA